MEAKIIENLGIILESEKIKRGISQEEMAKALDISLSTYKNIISGTVVDLKISTLLKIQDVTGKNISELLQLELEDASLVQTFNKLPQHRKDSLRLLIEVEAAIYEGIGECDETDCVTCFVPTGNMCDEMLYDATSFFTLDVAKYKKICPESIDYAIKITSNHLHPAYHMGDILLMHRGAPRDGDTGLFLHIPTARMHLCRFRQTQPCKLLPINEIGETILVDSYDNKSMAQWMKLGYVIQVMR